MIDMTHLAHGVSILRINVFNDCVDAALEFKLAAFDEIEPRSIDN